MSDRFSYRNAAPETYRAMLALHHYIERCGLEATLVNLIDLRVSQINGCAYCIDMHWKDLRVAGVSEQKRYMLSVWREWPEFTARERAALEWAEAVTRLANQEVPDDVYRRARAQFTEPELANLTLAVNSINSWNRLNIAFHTPAGTYQPKEKAASA